MFTGIIQTVRPIYWLEDNNETNERRLALELPFEQIELGESIALNGVCLTVAAIHGATAEFHLSPETLRRSNLASISKSSSVNIERALRTGDSLSGHWVQGHVDGMGSIAKISPEGDSWFVQVVLPSELMRYCVEKGSISIDGTSLTVNSICDDSNSIGLQIIPHTWESTIFNTYSENTIVNIEVDIIAKYVERQCSPFQKQ